MNLTVELDGITIKDENRVLEISPFRFSLDEENPFAVITGESGSGKTTFFRSFFEDYIGEWYVENAECLIKKKYTIDGMNIDSIKYSVGYAAQSPMLLPRKTIRENLIAPFKWRSLDDPSETEVEEIKHMLMLNSFFDGKVYQLSAGERQRLNIARALITRPSILLIDECFTSLDIKMASQIIKNLQSHYSKNCFFLVITHRPSDFENESHINIRFNTEEKKTRESGKEKKKLIVKVACNE